ncbi:MAG TPA: response regulator transcription factor [Solirubrobacteraceae bacterium]|jgi:DNA-binding NarL/FixJ family response regulator|nr:response regulator transcription factor [Solirubrobacteraceae bacterium]
MGHETIERSPGPDVLSGPPSPTRRRRQASADSRDPRAQVSIGLRNHPSTRPPSELSPGARDDHAGLPANVSGPHNHTRPPAQISDGHAGLPAEVSGPHDHASLPAEAAIRPDEDLAAVPAAWRAHLELERPRPAIAIVLIGGQRLLRDATASLLTAQDGLHVLGTFACAEEFMAASFAAPPAVLLLDGDGGHGECAAALKRLHAAPGGPRVVLLCRSTSEEIVRCAIEHRAGGVLLKSYSTADILAALAYTATGRTVLPAGWQRSLPSHSGAAALSRRHRQILALIATGRRNEEIALDLDLSPNTIKFHIRALYSRLGVRNRVEAANQYAQIAGGGGA